MAVKIGQKETREYLRSHVLVT